MYPTNDPPAAIRIASDRIDERVAQAAQRRAAKAASKRAVREEATRVRLTFRHAGGRWVVPFARDPLTR